MNKEIFNKCFDESDFSPIVEYINTKRGFGITSILDEWDWLYIVDISWFVIRQPKDVLKKKLIKLILQEKVSVWDKIETVSTNDASYIYRKDTWLRFNSFNWTVKWIIVSIWSENLEIVFKIFLWWWYKITKDMVQKSDFRFQRQPLDWKQFIESLNKEEWIQEVIDNIFQKAIKLSFVEKVTLWNELRICVNPEICRGNSVKWVPYWFSIPPLVILLDYRNWKYRVNSIDWTHPHVNSGNICLWTFQESINKNRRDVEYCLIMLYELLTTYNTRSPHFRPRNFSLSNCQQQTENYNKEAWTNHVYERVFYKWDEIVSYNECCEVDGEVNVLNF